MIQENEIVMLILGIGVIIFSIVNKEKMKTIPYWKLIVYTFLFLVAGWSFTVLEGFFAREVLNVLEHISYTFSSVLMFFWCFKISFRKK